MTPSGRTHRRWRENQSYGPPYSWSIFFCFERCSASRLYRPARITFAVQREIKPSKSTTHTREGIRLIEQHENLIKQIKSDITWQMKAKIGPKMAVRHCTKDTCFIYVRTCRQVTLLHLLGAPIDPIQKESGLILDPFKPRHGEPWDTAAKWRYFLDPKLLRPCSNLALQMKIKYPTHQLACLRSKFTY